MTDNRIEVAIGALAEQHHGRWELLIARRPEGTPYAGYWELPGGKCHASEPPDSPEPPETCLVREFAEELGITIRVGEALPIIEYDYAHGKVRIHPFICRREGGEPRNLRVAEHRWVGAEELAKYHFPPANDDLMQRLRGILTAPGGPNPEISTQRAQRSQRRRKRDQESGSRGQ